MFNKKENDFAAMLTRIVLQSIIPERAPEFINRLTSEMSPDVQVKLYRFVMLMICAWAERIDLSQENAEVIEDCRKICDVMGWAPGIG
jgi:hypothetical protein